MDAMGSFLQTVLSNPSSDEDKAGGEEEPAALAGQGGAVDPERQQQLDSIELGKKLAAEVKGANDESAVAASVRQKEIEDALKADFSSVAQTKPNDGEDERRQQIEAVMEGRKLATELKASQSFTNVVDKTPVDKSPVDSPPNPAASRQKDIEDALKADFNAAASKSAGMDDYRRKQVEAVLEGRVQVETGRSPSQAQHDPFDVRQMSGGKSHPPGPSVDEVLQAEMAAANSLKVDNASSATSLTDESKPSVQDVLQAELEAAQKMKEAASTIDASTSGSDQAKPNALTNRERKERKWDRKKNKRKKNGGKN